MDVRAAGFDADCPNDRERSVAHNLEFLVCERLNRRNRDRIACMNTHGIEVFDGANDHAVVFAITHDFHLVFLPTEQGFFNENFRHRREFQASFGNFVELFAIIRDAASSAAQRESRPDNERIPSDSLCRRPRLVQRVGCAANWNVQPDGNHQVFENLPVFAAFNRFGIGADHFEAEFFQSAAPKQRHGGVQSGLAAERRKKNEFPFRANPLHFINLARDDFLHALRCDRFDVRSVGKLGIRHDRGRIRVYQDNAIAFFLERFASLRARIIEFAGLPNDDRAGADDED